MLMLNFFRVFKRVGIRGVIKTVYWNFRLFPLGTAIKLPLLLGKRCSLSSCKRGCIQFTSNKIRSGILEIGTENFGFQPKGGTMIRIRGKLIINGNGRHWLGSNGYLSIKESGCLQIGEDFTMGNGWCIFISANSIIGQGCMFSWNILLIDTDCHPIKDENGNLLNAPQAFFIDDNVWLGACTTVLKGARIPSGSIIASNSNVNSDLVYKNSIYVNNNQVRAKVYWERAEL